MVTVRKGLLLVFVVLLILLVAAGAAFATQPKPTKVVIITMDQMKPWYAQAYDMTNILWLQKHGANFKKATVGQMASETVVSHNTIVSGMFPKHMGWSDEVMRLVKPLMDGKGGFYPAGSIVTVGDLSYDQYTQLIDDIGYPKLGDYMHEAFPGSTVANFGPKFYQVASTAASSSDIWVTYGSKGTVTDAMNLPWAGTYRGPSGGNVPDYIANDNRFKISTTNTTAMGNDYYGTKSDKPAYLYPEDGRHVPGPYASNTAGDDWATDAAIKVLENEDDWSALHLNFSGIDKIGHMYGGGPVDTLANFQTYNPTSTWMEMVHMAFIAKNADDQVGRLIKALKANGDWPHTLFVVLADHASTWAENAHYRDEAGGGNYSWYYDPNNLCANTDYGTGIGTNLNNDAVLAPLNFNGNLAYSYQSTAIEAWLIDQSAAMKQDAAEKMETMPGVIATYVREGDEYSLFSTGDMTDSEHKWWAKRAQSIIDTMAFEGAADVVGLLADRTSYGVYGDHGGAQKEVQRIPMVMYVRGMKHFDSRAPFRLADVMPTVLFNMGVKADPDWPMDGKAYDILR